MAGAAEPEFLSVDPGGFLDEILAEDYMGFLDRLYEVNKVMNLTRVPREEALGRHIFDSMLFQDLIPHGARVLDLGTGPGFPAWPLARFRSDLQITAIDSSAKMIGFLRGSPLANLRLVQTRAEEFGEREGFDVVTGRALAHLSVQLELSAAYAKLGGVVIPMRSSRDLDEIRKFTGGQIGLKLKAIEGRVLKDSNAPRLFPVYRKVRPTPGRYPRKWADIKRDPL
jgi:16S rRNA (guanine527-N7)-methyltransferase